MASEHPRPSLRLQLSKETLRLLSRAEHAHVQGGAQTVDTRNNSCFQKVCHD